MVTTTGGKGGHSGPMPGPHAAGREPDGGVDPDATATVEELEMVGGDACLDLVNTGSRRRRGPFRDRLHVYDDLVTWAERAALIDAETGAELRRTAAGDPAGGERVLARARELREAIYRAFSGAPRGEAPSSEDLEVVGREAARASAFRRLVPGDTCRCEYEWTESGELDRPLWPVALSAAKLATSDDLARVKECASENCNWLFIDASRNRSRRWCDMKDCGNRAKARRFRQKSRDA